jgi:two-component system, OmpR family, phosphate regulon response regulator OmpR
LRPSAWPVDHAGVTPDRRPDTPAAGPARRLLLFVGPVPTAEPEVAATLARSGWRCLWLADADAAQRAAHHARFDAVVLRAEGEGGPPPRVIEPLRRALGCPVLVLAEAADEVDEVIALELGADAWLTGPLTARRLRAHLVALLRPRDEPSEEGAGALPLGGWTLNVAEQRLERQDQSIGLTALQAGLLRCLAEQAGCVVSRAALAAAVGGGRDLHSRSVDVYVARLRRRLREARVDGVSIEGVRGRGYTLTVGVERESRATHWPWVPVMSSTGASLAVS